MNEIAKENAKVIIAQLEIVEAGCYKASAKNREFEPYFKALGTLISTMKRDFNTADK